MKIKSRQEFLVALTIAAVALFVGGEFYLGAAAKLVDGALGAGQGFARKSP